ncbi:unnamed protein product [Rotaria sp. Silwood1]|nr:unnamed protein product [Rotaria sp. Silwood1]
MMIVAFLVLFASYNLLNVFGASTIYGPSIEHYPSRTPTIAEAHLFDSEHKKVVPFNAAAIEEAANSFTDQQVNEGAVVFIKAGNVVGTGSGSRSTPFLKNIGKKGRKRKILITPIGDWGSCTFNDSVKIQSCYGIAFGGFKFTGTGTFGRTRGFLAVDCTESSLFNMAPLAYFGGQTLDNTPSWDIEFVNMVVPDASVKYDANNNADTAAFRTASNAPVNNVRFLGCYIAPSYREAGSKAHTDSLQFSGASAYSNIQLENTVAFGSTNAAIQVGAATHYAFIRTLIIGSKMTCVRYPVPSGADGYSLGFVNPNAVNGAATNATAIDSIIVGSIGSTRWAFQSGSTISYVPQSSQQPATGSKWAIDSSLLNLNIKWINDHVAYPTNTYLQQIFGNTAQTMNVERP